MLGKSVLGLAFFVFSQVGLSQVARPKLVVGLVVDQMRWDYLYRYSDLYVAGGFKRLLKEGFSAENTMIPYIPTVTGAGHTSLYTGSVPAVHGIIANDWVDTFREFHPEPHRYSWWSQRFPTVRLQNKGWRIDYISVTTPLKKNLKDAEIYPDVKHSDHCPIYVDVKL